MVLLTIKLEEDDALEFSDCGAVPDVGGGFGAAMIIGGMGMGMDPPRPETRSLAIMCP